MKRHPKRPGAHVLLGRISTDKCRQLLASYKAQAPTGQAQSDMVAKIHHQRTRAKSAFQRAAALDPTRAHPHVALSQLAAMDGKDAEAKEHLRDALAIDPDTRVDHALLTAGLDWRARLEFYRRIQERFQDTTKLPENLRAPKIGSLQFQIGRAQLDGLQFRPARATCREATSTERRLCSSESLASWSHVDLSASCSACLSPTSSTQSASSRIQPSSKR